MIEKAKAAAVFGSRALQSHSLTSAVAGPSAERPSPLDRHIILLDIRKVRRDGDTLHRIVLDSGVIKRYAALMGEGVEFPPVTVWFDGENYWLSDGFHRIAAAEQLGKREIQALIRHGCLSDAQWDSYAANGQHGLRRKPAEIRATVRLALQHPKAAALSNVELARHLSLPEATLRRWRKQLSSSRDEDTVRVVSRGQSTYMLRTNNIGKREARRHRPKSLKDLQKDLRIMKGAASPDTRRIIIILCSWALGTATSVDCLRAIEQVVKEWKRKSA